MLYTACLNNELFDRRRLQLSLNGFLCEGVGLIMGTGGKGNKAGSPDEAQ